MSLDSSFSWGRMFKSFWDDFIGLFKKKGKR